MGFFTARKLIARVGKGAATKQIGIYESVARWIARGIQLAFALVVVGLYGHRVDEDRRHGNSQSVAWVYATVVASMSCITCVVYAIPFVPVHRAFIWDSILAGLWLITFGVFAGIFLKLEGGTDYEGTSVRLMKIAAWIDLVNCILWLATFGYGVFRTYLGKKAARLENKVDNKLSEFEDKAVGKVTERLPPGMVPAHFVADRLPHHFV